MTTINISSGAAQYVGGTITETTGKDISGATFQVGITSGGGLPTVWFNPDVATQGSTTAQKVLKVLISLTLPTASPVVAAKTYTVWGKIADNPEIIPVTLQSFTTA